MIEHVCGVCRRVAHAPLEHEPPPCALLLPSQPSAMEEETSFFERERDRLTSEIASVSEPHFDVTIATEQNA